MCHKLTVAWHCPRSPASWTLALRSLSQSLGPPGPVTAPEAAACSSWALSPQCLVSLPTCQSSAVFRIILLHVVGGEPADLGKDEEAVRAATTCSSHCSSTRPTGAFPLRGLRTCHACHPASRASHTHTADLSDRRQLCTHAASSARTPSSSYLEPLTPSTPTLLALFPAVVSPQHLPPSH